MEPLTLGISAAVGGLILGEVVDEIRDRKVPSSDAEFVIAKTSLKPIEPKGSPIKTAKIVLGAIKPPEPEPLGNLGKGTTLKRGRWVSIGKVKKNRKLKRKLKKIRFYSSPPGALFLKSKSFKFNLIWVAMAPKRWQPGYKRAKRRNVRIGALKPLLGPKADWKTLTSTIGDMVEKLPEIIKAAQDVGTAVASGGATAGSADVDNILEVATMNIKAAKGIIKKSKARLRAADVIVGAMWAVWLQEFRDANPHVIKNGKVDLGKNYKANPKTTADLGASGNSYPWVFIPA